MVWMVCHAVCAALFMLFIIGLGISLIRDALEGSGGLY